MYTEFKALMKLQLLTQEMEKDLGLSEFSLIDTKVLLAVHAQSGMAATSRILAHQLLKTFSKPSLFRSLKTLEANGKIEKATEKRGYYIPINL
jgi:CTP-dependent riboflavin kinase